MGDKISDYPSKTTIHGDDLLDFSNTEDSGASYNQSQKVTVDQFMAYINSNISSIYNSDGNINENRILTSNGSFTKWIGGDVIVQTNNEIDDYAFLVQDQLGSERGRFGMDTASGSSVLELSNVSGTWFDANDEVIDVNSGFFNVSTTEVKLATFGEFKNIASFNYYGFTGFAVGEYAIGSNAAGRTNLNAASGQSLFFMNNNSEQWSIDGSGKFRGNTSVGMKVAAYSSGGSDEFGIGIQSGEFQNIIPTSGTPRFTCLSGDSTTHTELMTLLTNGSLALGVASPDASALLQMDSTTQGLLPPRMTAGQGSAIAPVDGLIIYVTSTNGTFTSVGIWAYENGAWTKL